MNINFDRLGNIFIYNFIIEEEESGKVTKRDVVNERKFQINEVEKREKTGESKYPLL